MPLFRSSSSSKSSDILLRIRTEKKKAAEEIKQIKNQIKDLGDKSKKAGEEGTKAFHKMRVSTSGLRRTLGAIRNQLLVFVFVIMTVKKALSFAVEARNVARDGDEIQSKFNTVFKELAEQSQKWAVNFGNAVGRATQDVKKWMSGLQDTFVPLGFARKRSQDLSQSLVKLAVDVASFNNKADDEVIRDFTSAIVGNHETVRKYGILITENSIKQEILNQGWDKSYNELSELEKVQLRYNIILNSTTDAQGDAIRTADSLANKEKRVAAVRKNYMEQLGKKVVPISKAYNDILIKLYTNLTKLVEVPMSEQLREENLEFQSLIRILQDSNTHLSTRNKIIDTLQSKYGDYIGNIDLEKAGYEDLADILKKANDEFERKINLAAAEEVLIESKKRWMAAVDALLASELRYQGVLNGTIKAEDRMGSETLRLPYQIDAQREAVEKLKDEYNELYNTLTKLGYIEEIEPPPPRKTPEIILYDQKSLDKLDKELDKIKEKLLQTQIDLKAAGLTREFEKNKTKIQEELNLKLAAIDAELLKLEDKKAKSQQLTKEEEDAYKLLNEQRVKLTEIANKKILALEKEKNLELKREQQKYLQDLADSQEDFGASIIYDKYERELQELSNQTTKILDALKERYTSGLMFEHEYQEALTEINKRYAEKRTEILVNQWIADHEFINNTLKSLETGYDEFWQTLTDKDMTGTERRNAIWKSMKESFISMLGDMIKQVIIAQAIKMGLLGAEIAASAAGSTAIALAWTPAAVAANIATLGGAAGMASASHLAYLTTALAIAGAKKGLYVDKEQMVKVGEKGTKEVIVPVDRFWDFVSGKYKLPGGHGIEKIPINPMKGTRSIPAAYAKTFSSANNYRYLHNVSNNFNDQNIVTEIRKLIEINNGSFSELINKDSSVQIIDKRPLIGNLSIREKEKLFKVIKAGQITLEDSSI